MLLGQANGVGPGGEKLCHGGSRLPRQKGDRPSRMKGRIKQVGGHVPPKHIKKLPTHRQPDGYASEGPSLIHPIIPLFNFNPQARTARQRLENQAKGAELRYTCVMLQDGVLGQQGKCPG